MLTKETKAVQYQMATYCKTGEATEIMGAKQDRLHNYRRLIYNIIDDAIENAYPIARNIIPSEQWQEMVDTFIAEHKCQHPQIMHMPGEFIAFTDEFNYAEKFNIPFLHDLLHFEWVEVLVHTMKDQVIPDFNEDGNLLTEQLIFSPYFQMIELEYPIHRLRSTSMEDAKGLYYILVYRQESGTVQYVELNQLTAYLLNSILENECTLKKAILPLIENADETTTNNFTANALQFMENLVSMGILKGTVR